MSLNSCFQTCLSDIADLTVAALLVIRRKKQIQILFAEAETPVIIHKGLQNVYESLYGQQLHLCTLLWSKDKNSPFYKLYNHFRVTCEC